MFIFEKMFQSKSKLLNLRTEWFLLIIINFIFGICGIVTCTLKLQHGDQGVDKQFFNFSLVFAACNIIVNILLLIAVIKNNQKYAFMCAFLSFITLFFAVIHVETSTTVNVTFLIVFITLGILFFFWFCVFGVYQLLYREMVYYEADFMTEL